MTRAIAALVLGFSVLLGCWREPTFVEVKTDRAKLVDGIESYLSPSQFRQYASSRSLLIASEEKDFSDVGKRPPFNFLTLVIDEYDQQGFRGELRITFFNDRLM